MDQSIIAEFLNEVEGYLPQMSHCLEVLQVDNNDQPAIEQLHRISHTIKGAAAMVGIDSLSSTGEVLEQTMEKVLAGDLVLDNELLALISTANQQIDFFCQQQRAGKQGEGRLPANILAAFARKLNAVQATKKTAPSSAPDGIAGILDQLLTPEEETEDDIFLLNDELEEKRKNQESLDQELLACFAEEIAEHQENIDAQLREISAAVKDSAVPTDSLQEQLRSLRRSVHTVKGAAAVIGIEPIASWGHQFEDFLDWLHDDSPTLEPQAVAAMQDGVDILARLAEDSTCSVAKEQEVAMALFQKIMAEPEKSEQSLATDLSSSESVADIFLSEDEAIDASTFFDELTVSDNDNGIADESEDLQHSFGPSVNFFTEESSDDLIDQLFPTETESAVSEDIFAPEEVVSSESNADTIDPELLSCFAEETSEHLENIDLQLRELRQSVREETVLSEPLREHLHSLRRSVHTLKGAAAVIGIESVAAWGHQFEDFLDWLHDESPTLEPQAVATMQDGADILAQLSENPASSLVDEQQALADRFQAMMTAPQSVVEPVSSVKEDLFFAEEQAEESSDDLIDELFPTETESAVSEDIFAPEEAVSSESSTDAIDPELLECFAEETSEHLENIDLQLRELQQAVTEETVLSEPLREHLHSLRRSVHTLKGAAAVIGIEPVAAWGHQFEDFLDWLHDESPTLEPQAVAAMQDGADILAQLSENPASSLADEQQALADRFQAMMTAPQSVEEPVSSVEEDLSSSDEAADIFFAEEQAEESSDDLIDELFPTETESAASEDIFASEEPVSSPESSTDAIDPELLECFAEETSEHLENIDLQLRELRQSVREETVLSEPLRENLHSLRRSVHTLKGAAAVIGIESVAAWGHQFEDFLDWLHDDSPTLEPQAVAAMQDGADLLVRITEKPTQDFTQEKETVTARFSSIIAGEKTQAVEEELAPVAVVSELEQASTEQVQEEPEPEPASVEPAPAKEQTVSGVRKVNTLRVEISKIDQVVGLSGDMVINLSSFEASMSAMSGTLNELGMILQRLKSINHSLEAGYELATIPYLRGMGDSGEGGITEDFDPLEMDRYSELNILIRSLSEAVSDLDSIMTQSALENTTWQKTVERQTRVLKNIQNRMIGLRMTPLSVLSARMQRTVREAERSTGHPAQLVIEGESIMMDTRVWDTMADALMHILRNSVAHGGSPEQQLTVYIKAERHGGQFSLRIKDDGKGLNYEAIRAKGMKLYPLERIGSLSNEKLANLIFRHGFSSAGTVSNIAGRGVGMDVVRDAVELLNGSVEIFSLQGQGLELLIRLPVAVAQLHAVLVRLAGQIYAVPMHDISSAERVKPEEITDSHYETDSGRKMPLIKPIAIPGFQVSPLGEVLPESELAVLIIRIGNRQAALLCEQIIGQRDIVFKDLGSHLDSVSCIAGMTIMGDGSLVPILQTEDLLTRWIELSASEVEATLEEHAEERVLQVLVVDDSISVRKVVSNFLLQQGWQPTVARNGIEALEHIREERPDLVLLDVEMPRMNGFEVLQALQSQPDLLDIPVVMLTSRSADKYREKASQLGARGFMTKPFKEDEAIELIRRMTSRQVLAELTE